MFLQKKSVKGIDVKKKMDRLSVRVIEEVEDKEVTSLEDVFKTAQEIYEARIRDEGILVAEIPCLLNIRRKRFLFWMFLIILYFTLLLIPFAFPPAVCLQDMSAHKEMIVINAVIFIPMFLYFFYRSPYIQLKKVLEISNKKIMKLTLS